jgi:dTDP-4-amino-4,6-dideoxygalactose transaminase
MFETLCIKETKAKNGTSGMNARSIPISDPGRAVKKHAVEIMDAITAVVDSGRYVGGNEVSGFEREFAHYLHAGFAVGVGSGTDALQLALRTCGVGPGDRVATVSHTAAATVAAIELTGAIPVLVEVGPDGFTMDPHELEGALEAALRQGRPEHIRAIIPVHLYGHPSDMSEIMRLAAKYNAFVVEDCAQAHGASINGRKCGTWGDLAAFSFYPTKNLGAVGDGGAVVTNDPELAERARRLHEYGWRTRYICEAPGMNTRLDAIQAAILRIRLKYLDQDNTRRQAIAMQYMDALCDTPYVLPTVATGVIHVYHQYVLRTSRRDEIRVGLAQRGVDTAVLYPQPIHLQPAYRERVPCHGPLTRSTQLSSEILSIPVFPELSDLEVSQVIQALLSCL